MRFVSLLAVLLLLHASVEVRAQGTNKPDPEQIQTQLQALRAEINAVKAVIISKDREQSAVEKELQRVGLAIADSARAVVQINGELAKAQDDLTELNSQAEKLSSELKQQRQVLAKLLRSAYAIGQLEQVKLALSQAKVARVGRVLAYHTYVNQARVDAIATIQKALTQLRSVQQQIVDKKSELVSLLTQESQRSAELSDRKAEREALLVQLRAELEVGNNRVNALNSDIDQLNDLLARLTDVLADIPKVLPNAHAFSSLRGGKMPWPIRGSLVREFGALLEGGRLASGILIQASEQREVHAVAGGRVAFADWLRGFGMLLIIDHGDGYLSLYGQCETLLKSEGEWIEADQIIATLGQDPLHFEIRKSGEPVNPANWLSKP